MIRSVISCVALCGCLVYTLNIINLRFLNEQTEHKTNNIGRICNRKEALLADYTVTENVHNDPNFKGVVTHISKILIAAIFLLLLTTKLNNSKSWKRHI